ncbi:hypothetical protein O181_105277 [Austropuccinia psidii MF-1]|uniref:Uncharacterized protein n=1 Tax=Austropuccinia psidii MF-1 TaxID=1389203 RepID=A0A9Q3JPR4_9BASI|nr:hypothetical protein [Austropuccinia psidii MF-1]
MKTYFGVLIPWVTSGPSSNVLSPSPSFIGWIITSLQSRSEVTIGWWPRRGGGQIDTGRDRANRPESFPLACLGWQCPFSLGNTFIIIDHKGVLPRASWAGAPLAVWSEGSDNKQASPALVVVKEQIQGIPSLVHKVNDI